MEKFILPKGYLSASAIATLLRCPKQYEFRYIHDIVAPPSVALIVGSATHATFEGYFSDYLISKKRVTHTELREIQKFPFFKKGRYQSGLYEKKYFRSDIGFDL